MFDIVFSFMIQSFPLSSQVILVYSLNSCLHLSPAPTRSTCDVNLDLCHHSDPPCLRVCCDDVLHVTDTRYNGKYQWRCVRVDKHTGAPLQAGAVPNYNRYIMHAIDKGFQ